MPKSRMPLKIKRIDLAFDLFQLSPLQTLMLSPATPQEFAPAAPEKSARDGL